MIRGPRGQKHKGLWSENYDLVGNRALVTHDMLAQAEGPRHIFGHAKPNGWAVSHTHTLPRSWLGCVFTVLVCSKGVQHSTDKVCHRIVHL